MKNLSELRNNLEQAKTNLKIKFVGIDDVIDSLIDKISTWYYMPELMTRPTIINLWGLTGVGKTDLIRSLVKELKFNDMFLELQLSGSKESTSFKSIEDELNYSNLQPETPGILLLDEIQRFRTVTENGEERQDYIYQDLWMLLSDGKFASKNKKTQLYDIYLQALWDIDDKENNESNEDTADGDSSTPVNSSPKRSGKTKKYSTYAYRASSLKKLLKSKESVEEIMTWKSDKILLEINSALNDPSFNSQVDYSNLLIFMSGNLDEAFTEAFDVSEAERDADILRKHTERVSIMTIKNALTSRFKPEQIARFGNSHIIVPSLSRKTFETLIDKRLKLYEKNVNFHFENITIKFDETINDLLYQNGVFPLQGVRPLYSTIDEFFNMFVPTSVMKSINEQAHYINFSYDKVSECVKVCYDGGLIEVFSYVGVLDRIRNKNIENKQDILRAAVHESGHTLLYYVLFGVVPEVMLVNTLVEGSQGYIVPQSAVINQSMTSLCNLMAVYYGGYEAERLVFGRDEVSNGCSSDILSATQIAGNIVKRYGHASSEYHVTPYDYPTSAMYWDTTNDTSSKQKLLLEQSRQKAVDILQKYSNILVELTELATVKHKLSENDLRKFFDSKKIETNTQFDYIDAFCKFKQLSSELPPSKL